MKGRYCSSFSCVFSRLKGSLSASFPLIPKAKILNRVAFVFRITVLHWEAKIFNLLGKMCKNHFELARYVKNDYFILLMTLCIFILDHSISR